jgi:hypothetical protein
VLAFGNIYQKVLAFGSRPEGTADPHRATGRPASLQWAGTHLAGSPRSPSGFQTPRLAANQEQEEASVPHEVDIRAASRKRPRAATGDDSALRLATQQGRALTKAGANASADGWAELLCAAEEGHESCVRALLEAGADVDAKSDDGSTALMMACTYHAEGCVHALIDAGANVDLADKEGYTALMLACSEHATGYVRALIDAGAAINAQNMIGWTALMMTCEESGGEEILAMLIEAGADMDLTNKLGKTAFCIAYEHSEEAHAILIQAAADRKRVRLESEYYCRHF